ncbi:high-affinity nickel-transport family protein [Abeliophyllum distichum]|uniref:High-affinity nickel-transport family protein n=1 Tax=Abeliophyllum distichum TaxID=126358 RepID=A0ABD1TID6_9LAMI
MDRLIYSNSVPSKIHCLKPSCPLLLRLPRVDSAPRLGFSSFPRSESRRVSSLSCKLHNPSSHSLNSCDNFPGNLLGSADLSDGARPTKPHCLKRIAQTFCEPQKVVTSGTVILISAIFLALVHPVVVSPALASFQSVAKTGGPVAAAAGSRLIHSELLSSAWTGFFAGCLHTLSGPDHLAALAPLSIGLYENGKCRSWSSVGMWP